MIRSLGSEDHSIRSLLLTAPEQNLVMLASLPQLGADGDLVRFWGQFGAEHQPIAILLRYGNLWYVHAEPGADLPALAGIISRTAQERAVLNGPPDLIATMAEHVAEFAVEQRLPSRLRVLRQPVTLPERGGLPVVRQATLDDVPDLAAFYASAPADLQRGADSLRRSVTGGRRTFLALRGRAVTACALTTAELPDLALAGGLHGEGRMWDADLTAALGALCAALQAEGKAVCTVTRTLWVDHICDALGFADLAPWLILHLKR